MKIHNLSKKLNWKTNDRPADAWADDVEDIWRYRGDAEKKRIYHLETIS